MSLVYFIQTSSKPQEAGTASRSKNNDNDNESKPIWVKHNAELFHIISTVMKEAVKLKFAD